VVQSAHLGLFSTCYPKAVYIFNPDLAGRVLAIDHADDKAIIRAVPLLVRTLELPAPTGRFDLTIVTDDAGGTAAETRGVPIPV
jgi:hypothetical protein